MREEPSLYRSQGDEPSGLLVNPGFTGASSYAGQFRNGGMIEDLFWGDLEAGFSRSCGDLDTQYRIAAYLEEIVTHAGSRHVKNGFPYASQFLLDFASRRFIVVFGPWLPEINRRQPASVYLSARGKRKLVQNHKPRRSHVVRQFSLQVVLYVRHGRRVRFQRQISYETVLTRLILAHSDRAVSDGGMPVESRLDLERLDSETAKLDLAVASPYILYRSVRPIEAEVSASIQPLGHRFRKGVRCEALRRRMRAVEIASRQTRACYTYLACHPNWLKAEIAVQDQDNSVTDRRADRYRLPVEVRLNDIASRGHGCFSRPVHVREKHSRKVVEHAARQRRIEPLSAADYPAQRLALDDSAVVEERIQHRWNRVKSGDFPLRDKADQVARVILAAGARDHQRRAAHQRVEYLADRRVESNRVFLQDPVRCRQWKRRGHPLHVIRNRRVADDYSFWFSGRSRSVNNVRNLRS